MSWLTRLFRRKTKEENGFESAKTAPLDPERLAAPVAVPSRRHLAYGLAQSTGIERSHNEDALFVMVGQSRGQEDLPDFGLFVVADGMGGHRAGELASAISVRTVARHLTERTVLRMLDERGPAEDIPLQDLVREALETANMAVVSEVPGGGTTLTAVVLHGSHMTIGHVGDSRAYILTEEETKVLTRDHSLVERLKELGQLSPEEAAHHPQRNVLYRAIGQGANLEVDVGTYPVPKGGFLLVCSDGLWGVVPEEEIRRIIFQAPDPQTACDELVRAANAAGGPDNITAVLVYFPATS